jgi:hypothetical protein
VSHMNNFIRNIVSTAVLAVGLSIGGFFVSDTLEGCTKAQEQAVVATLPPLGACIIEAAGGDFVEALTDPASLISAVASSCMAYGSATASVIAQVIESWFAAAPAVLGSDAAVDAVADAAVSAKLRGAASVQSARLRKVQAAALALAGK